MGTEKGLGEVNLVDTHFSQDLLTSKFADFWANIAHFLLILRLMSADK
jgi:hypothetical protein